MNRKKMNFSSTISLHLNLMKMTIQIMLAKNQSSQDDYVKYSEYFDKLMDGFIVLVALSCQKVSAETKQIFLQEVRDRNTLKSNHPPPKSNYFMITKKQKKNNSKF